MRNPPKTTQELIRLCTRDLEHAQDYRSWRDIASDLDRLEGNDVWRADETSDDYDHLLIRERLTSMRRLREQGSARELAFELSEGLHGNLGNLSNPVLYGVARVGTKHLIEDYVEEAARCLDFLCDGNFPDFPDDQKILFFKRSGGVFGRSALMLSGGATLGMFHLGVIKALHGENLLPRVLSGSSAGAVIAASVGTRTDDELGALFSPAGVHLEAFEWVGLSKAIRGRGLLNPAKLEQCIALNIPDETFVSAFERTRRIVGITVSPADPHQHGRLLNYLSAPHVLMRRAVLASCAVPHVFPAVLLHARNFDGETVPYMPGQRWVDGSLSNDLPMLRTARLHNVNHYIVSQTNPHIVPFLQAQPRQPRRGLRPLAMELLTQGTRGALRLARQHLDPYGGGRVVNKLDSILSQRYSGDINLVPEHTPQHLLKLFANLTEEDLQAYIRDGERRTWPQLERIRVQTRISRAFESCLLRLKDRSRPRRSSPLRRASGF